MSCFFFLKYFSTVKLSCLTFLTLNTKLLTVFPESAEGFNDEGWSSAILPPAASPLD